MIRNGSYHNKRHYVDWWLLVFVLILMAYGSFVLYSAGGYVLMKKQLIRFGLGLVVMLFLAQLKPERLALFTPWLFFCTVMLLVGVMFFGIETKGAQRWINIGIRFQPSELAKPLTIIAVSWSASLPMRRLGQLGHVLPVVVLGLFPMFLVGLQPDFGSALVFLPICMAILFVSGIRKRYILWPLLAAILLAPTCLLYTSPSPRDA